MVFGSIAGAMVGGASVSIVINAIDSFSGTFTKAQVGMASMGKSTKMLSTAFIGLGAVTAAVFAGTAIKSLKTFIDYQSAFTGVRKTVELTEQGFEDLENRFKSIAETTPVSFIELSRIGELAGQLGVSGVDNLEKFTKTIADISVTTNLTAEQAATDFARIANIMQEPLTNVDRMGAAIVGLGNNFATTEAEISLFAQRIAAGGKIAGMQTPDILALGAAFSSVGVRAEMGGTAVNMALAKMVQAVNEGGDKLQGFAQVADMSMSEFKSLFEDDATKAFEEFVLGLGRDGGDAFKTLDDLGLGSARLKQAFLSLAGAGDLVSDAISQGRDEWEKNNALTDEAEKRYATLESQLAKLSNVFSNIFNDVGADLEPAFKDLLVTIEENKEGIATFANAIGSILVGSIDIGVKGIGALDKALWEAASFWSIVPIGIGRKFDDHKKFMAAMDAYEKQVIKGKKSIEEFALENSEFAKVLTDVYPELEKYTNITVLDTIATVENSVAKDENTKSTLTLADAQSVYDQWVEKGTFSKQEFIDTFPEMAALLALETELFKEETVQITDQQKALEALDKLKRRGNTLINAPKGTEKFYDKYFSDKDAGRDTATYDTSFGSGSSSSSSSSTTKPWEQKEVSADYYTMGDFMSRPGEKPISFSENDTIIGMKSPQKLGGGGSTVIVNIESVQGLDVDEIANALQQKLLNMVST